MPRTLHVFFPLQLNAQAYDTAKQAFPLYSNRPFSVKNVNLGHRNVPLRCIDLDRNFELKEFPVAAGDAEGFLNRNRDRPKPAFGATVFIGVNLTVTGKTIAKPGRPVKCKLTAQVNSIEGYEFKGMENRRYGVNTVSPGVRLTNFYARNVSDEAQVTTPFKAQSVSEATGADAKAFELLTKNGLPLLSPRDALRGSVLLSDLDAIENLKTYADFLMLHTAPDMFKTPGVGNCFAREYPDAADYSAYFTGQGTSARWKGDNEFEIKRAQQAFYNELVPKLQNRASATPQRFLIVARINMPAYDFTHSGFRFTNLTPSANTNGFFGRCGIQQSYIRSVDWLEEFWPLAPDKAEAAQRRAQRARNGVGGANARKQPDRDRYGPSGRSLASAQGQRRFLGRAMGRPFSAANDP